MAGRTAGTSAAPLALLLFFFAVALPVGAGGVAGCSRGDGTPAVDEATLRADDRREVERLVLLDFRVSQAMHDADKASVAGDAGAASSLVSRVAEPAVDEAIRTSEAASLKTAWGKSKKEEIVAILRDRRAEMAKYGAAVKSDDPDALVAAIQAQAAIEQRAMSLVTAVQENR